MGILFIFVRNLFMHKLALNLPFFISAIASVTGLESGRIMIGCLDSLRIGYSVSMAFASDSASTLHGDHLLHCSESLDEWYRTGSSAWSLTANSVCPTPGAQLAASGIMTSWSDGWGR